ncbi:MAG: 4a-hydroxytetrahydrobiopterin dehydratase [Elainellaceae cyanobacterium]
MAQLLNQSDAQQRVNQLPNWSLEGKTIQCTREFKDFVEAINFVNRLVEPAEAAGHHPDISISYNKVTIELTSHDAGGLTDSDFEMANVISDIK